MKPERLRVGYVGVAFESYYAAENNQFRRAIDGLMNLAAEMDFELIAVDKGVSDVDGAREVAAHLSSRRLDFLMLEIAACSSGEVLVPFTEIAPRLGIWGTPDPAREGPIQIHSLVSLNQYASIIRKHLVDRDIPFKWFFGHVEEPEFLRRIQVTIRALQGIKAMSCARIGWIGGISPGFYNMEFDEIALGERLGTTVGRHTIAEIVERARRADERMTDAVIEHATALAAEVTAPRLGMDRNARIYLALKDLIEEESYDALAVQCWPTFQTDYKVVPCMAYSLLGSEDGFAVSCEGDLPGAVSMLLMNSMSSKHGSSTLLDLTALDVKSNAALLWHCGVTPRHFGKDHTIRWVDHVTIGRKSGDRIGVSGDLVFAPQTTTIAYTGDDFSKIFIAGAQIIETDATGFDGTRGWFSEFHLNGEPISLADLLNTVIVRGQQHHYAVAQGDLTSELSEVAAWLRMGTVQPVPTRDYLQIEGVNA
jgi:L-fucose isomerase-like protein